MRATPLATLPSPVGSTASVRFSLFEGIDADQFGCVQTCLGVRAFGFERGEEILACNKNTQFYGVLHSGVAFDVRRHPGGETTLVDVIEPGHLFGEGWRDPRWSVGERPRERATVGACSGVVLLFDPARLSDPSVACPAKTVVQNNLLRSVLHKEERLRAKLEMLRHRSLRARIANFLLLEFQRRGVTEFALPFSRAELAQYLLADRAALSRELSRMKSEGILDIDRNTFTLSDVDTLVSLTE